MKAVKAVVAKVSIGSQYTIDGLRLDDGTFAVSVSQFAALISIRQDDAQRDFKTALGEGFQFDTCTSDLNSQKVNVLSLSQFEILLTKYDREGNIYAKALRDALIGMALPELFCDSFRKPD
jgi:hypothetical protein